MRKIILVDPDTDGAADLRASLRSEVQVDAEVADGPAAAEPLLARNAHAPVVLGLSYAGDPSVRAVVELTGRSSRPVLVVGPGQAVLAVRRVGATSHAGGNGLSAPAAIHRALEQEQERREREAHLERLSRMAVIDSLTGIANRAHFDEVYERELRRTARHGGCLAVAMMDVDAFKRINDTFGHQAGDQALQAVGSVLRANVRASDVVARYGGDEFVALMPETAESGARAVVQRIVEALSRFNATGQLPFGLSLSTGIGTSERDADPLQVADRRMYENKRAHGTGR